MVVDFPHSGRTERPEIDSQSFSGDSDIDAPAGLPVFTRRETRVRLKSHVQHYRQRLSGAIQEVDDIIHFDDAQASDEQKKAVQERIQAYGQKVLQVLKESQLWLHMYELTEPHQGGLVDLRNEIRSRRLCVHSVIKRAPSEYNLQRTIITDKALAVSAMLIELSDANVTDEPRGWWGRIRERSSEMEAADERVRHFS